ncbi:MAG: peptidoglycan LD-endopeptidase LytH [Frankiaceae bacterium]|nr:peptidoglycan LD-endopeptidase LytH [Frankiaceae bacterium]
MPSMPSRLPRLARAICAFAAAGLVLSAAPTAFAAPTRATTTVVTHPTLRSGSSGAAVVRLQKLLGVPADGQFGPMTRRAVVSFQVRHRLPATGVVNAATWNALILAARASRNGGRDASVYACPVAGPVHFTDTFGAPRSGGRTHQGTDMLAARGTPVVAIEDGIVEKAYVNTLGGISIILRGRSGDTWFYTHNDRNLVRTGQRVIKGQRIALVGSTGDANGTNHLHFEWWPNGGAARDSYPIVKAACG